MIERLFPEEWDFGGDERREMELEAAEIRETLAEKLDPEGKYLLENLQEAFIRSSNFEIKDAFTQGFCNGIDLMMEYCEWRRGHDSRVSDIPDS